MQQSYMFQFSTNIIVQDRGSYLNIDGIYFQYY